MVFYLKEAVNAKLRDLIVEEKELKEKLSKLSQNSEKVNLTLARMMNLLSRLPELFAGSQPEQKRKILKLLFANLSLNGKKIEFIYKKPFQLLLEGPNGLVWGG